MKQLEGKNKVHYVSNFTYDCNDEEDKDSNLLCPNINDKIKDKLVLQNSLASEEFRKIINI